MVNIINYGRGPEIEGTRITVYDVLHYHLGGWHPTAIAGNFRLSSAQIQAALDYVEAHKEEVMEQYRKIEERIARGNPPEVQAKLDAIHAKYNILWADKLKRAGLLEDTHEGNSTGH